MLHIYITSHCHGCETARERAATLQGLRPDVALEVVDVDEPGADVPAQVIGTPMYLWNNRVIFWGNPSMTALLDLLAKMQDTDEHSRTR